MNTYRRNNNVTNIILLNRKNISFSFNILYYKSLIWKWTWTDIVKNGEENRQRLFVVECITVNTIMKKGEHAESIKIISF